MPPRQRERLDDAPTQHLPPSRRFAGHALGIALRILLPVALTFALFVGTLYLVVLPTLEQNLLEAKREMIRELCATAWELLASYEERVRSGELSETEAQQRALARIRTLRYGPESKDYFWINDLRPTLLMHPYRPDLEGQDVSGFSDPNGKHLFRAFVDVVQERGAGYVEYLWQWKDDPSRVAPKLSYVRGFQPWGWIIGTGVYTEDVHATISGITRKLNRLFVGILSLVVALSGYVVWRGARVELERSRALEELRLEECRMEILLALNQMADASVEHIAEFALESAVRLTRSASGTVAILEGETPSQVRHWPAAPPAETGGTSPSTPAGRVDPHGPPPWEEAARTRKPILRNEAPLRVMHVPLLEEARVAVVTSVEGKGEDYTGSDVRQITLLSHGMWRLLQRKRSREELEEKEHVIFSSSNSIVITDLQGRLTYVNPAFLKTWRFRSAEDVLGRPFDALWTPDDRNDTLREIHEALERGSAWEGELKARRQDGVAFDAHLVANTVHDKHGSPVARMFFSLDITKRKRAEEARRESEETFRAIGDSAQDAILMLDPAGRATYWNAAATTIFGHERQEALGRDLLDLLAPEPLRDPYRKVLHAFLGADPPPRLGRAFELTAARKDGVEIPVEVSLAAVSIQGAWQAVAVVRNIAGRKAAEEDRRRLEEQLRQSQKMEAIGRLAGGVAHDFNNLLTGIQGYAEILLDSLSPDDPLYPDVLEILRAGERASSLTSQLLAFSRRQILSPKVLDLNEVVGHSRKMLARLIGENIVLEFHPDEHVWPIRADPGQVDQILVNLVVNARDAMPDGGRLTIETANVCLDERLQAGGPQGPGAPFVVLTVRDTGMGIDDETREHIFEPFFSTKNTGEGTGLGLATVYGIVRQHDGLIRVSSQPGAGTAFRIYFPRVAGAPEALPRTGAAALPGGTERVLLVEDEVSVRALAWKILTRHGYTVLEAHSCRHAFELHREHPGGIDLLLTDVVMPQMNGRKLFEQLLRLQPGLKVLYMSGYPEDVIAHHGVLEPGTFLLSKPFTAASLLHKTREVLDAQTRRSDHLRRGST